MPRPDIDLSPAISAAKEVFWRRGYEDTSIEEVVQATGLNRYALYNAFGGKLEIFLAALEAYHNERKQLFLDVLGDPERSPMDAIQEVSEFCISQMADRNAGCLMCNIALEISHHDDIIAVRVNSYLEEIRSAKEMALMQASERGELNPAITPRDGASLLVANMLGMGALARNGASRIEMLNIFNTGMAVLSHPDVPKKTSVKRRAPSK